MHIGLLANGSLAIPTLQYLLEQQKVQAVGIPGRGNEYTQQMELMCEQAEVSFTALSKHELDAQLASWVDVHKLEMVLVYTFPWLLPAHILSLPKHGFYNVHFAPLPAYRGAAPLFWVIKNRESQGGFCIHQMTEQFDKGAVVYRQSLTLAADDTLGTHMGKLSLAAVKWTEDFLRLLEQDNLQPLPQVEAQAKTWPQPELKDLLINWSELTAKEVSALVQATNPYYGGAITYYQQFPIRILAVTIVDGSGLPIGIRPGTILNSQDGTVLFVACKHQGLLRIDVIKLEEGYFPGAKLFAMGVQPGSSFVSNPNHNNDPSK